MASTTLESLLTGALTALFLVAVVVQVRQRRWYDVVAYGLAVLLGLYLTVETASGVLFVGPGGHGGISVP